MRIVSKLLRRAGAHAWQIFTRPLSQDAPPVPDGIAVRLLSPSDSARLGFDPELEIDARKVSEAVSQGEVCVGAFLGEALAGYAWFACQPAPHSDGIWMDFDRGGIYTYRAFVHPRYRGRGIAPALYRAADRVFLESGRRFAVLCIEATNVASLAAARRAGARRAGFAAYWRRGRRFRFWRTRGADPCGFRFYMPG